MKFKKIILTVFFVFSVISSLYPQQYWLNMASPVSLELKKSCFLDSLNGWVAGDSGLIMKTTTGGQNWIIQDSRTRYPVHEIFFLNKRLGWALAWNLFGPLPPFGTFILKTTNGGNSWDTSIFATENTFIQTVYFQDSLFGFMGGNNRNIMRTTDGGANWYDCQIDTILVSFLPVTSFTFYNRDYGYATGGQQDFAGIVWRTTNRGVRWTPTVVAGEPMWNVVFRDSMRIIGISGDPENGPGIVTTTNSGGSWKYDYLGFFGRPSVMAFRNSNEVWAPLKYSGGFIYSLDTGISWNAYVNPDSTEVNHVTFPDSKHGYAFCGNGKIMKYNPALIGIGNQNNNVPKNFMLYQNYPNPFNPSTNISYDLKRKSYVELKVYDISGKELKTLFRGTRQSGKYTSQFSGINLSSGIYFYQILIWDLSKDKDNFYQETKKMILLK